MLFGGAGNAGATTQARFNTFLSQTDPEVDRNLSDAAKQALFQRFLAWDRQRSAAR